MPEDAILTNLRAAAEALARGQSLPPFQLTEEAETATRAISRTRDILIARLREAGEGARSTPESFMLDEVNAILSQCIAIQFPAAGVNRQEIEKTREAIERLIRSHTSTPVP